MANFVKVMITVLLLLLAGHYFELLDVKVLSKMPTHKEVQAKNKMKREAEMVDRPDKDVIEKRREERKKEKETLDEFKKQ